MGTGRPNPNTSLHKILPFPKKPSHESCSMCIRLASGESLWVITQDERGARLFEPLDDARLCPKCGTPVEALT